MTVLKTITFSAPRVCLLIVSLYEVVAQRFLRFQVGNAEFVKFVNARADLVRINNKSALLPIFIVLVS